MFISRYGESRLTVVDLMSGEDKELETDCETHCFQSLKDNHIAYGIKSTGEDAKYYLRVSKFFPEYVNF